MATTSKTTTSSKSGAKAPAKKTATKSVVASSEKKTVAKKKSATSTAAKKNPVTKKSAAKAVSTAAKKAPVKKRSTAKLVAEKPSAKAVAKKTSNIKLVVKFDVGFGNSLFVRGDAPGLSWEKGTEMTNASGDEWVWETKRSTKAYELKVLINDRVWDAGENLVLKEQNITHYPAF